MSLNTIIRTLHSDSLPNSRSYLITNELLKLYSKFTGCYLINLYNLNEIYNTFGWYFDKEKKNLFQICLIVDSNNLHVEDNNNDILKALNLTSCTKLSFYLNSIKRNEICNKISIFESINIYEPGKNPEYFKLLDFKTEEIQTTIYSKNNKRKKDNTLTFSKNKKVKLNDDINWKIMVSASSTRNYFLNDPIIDWLKEYNIKSIDDLPSIKYNNQNNFQNMANTPSNFRNISDTPFTQFIMDQGCQFEEKVIEIIKQKHDVVQVAESYQSTNIKLFEKTITLMKKGVKIIYQGILHDYDNKTFGAPDLMIRSDYLNKFIGYNIYNETFGSPKLNTKWHYVIVDIKHSQINLTADITHISNSDSIPAYKGQLLIYTNALNSIQGSNVKKAFILGKKYSYCIKKNTYYIHEFMNKLGTIDYDGFDKEYNNKLIKAIEWIQSVRTDGHNWQLLPLPTKEELYPNMKNDKDGMYNKIKKSLAEEIHEITSVYYCGIKNRKEAMANGIFGWNNKKCTSKTLGFNDGKIANRVDAILKINRQNTNIILPKNIKYNDIEWRTRNKNEMEFYLDYETINSNFGTINVDNTHDNVDLNIIFMIGVGYEKNKKWEFKSFTAKKNTNNEEKKILDSFWNFINKKLKESGKTVPIFVHWSNAERTIYNKSRERHPCLPQKKMIDLYQVFINEPIVIKGALNYSLKSVAKALFDNNLITTIWDNTSSCANGLNAMLLAYQVYNDRDSNPLEDLTMKEIEKYNEIDCKCLWEIINYLRKNH